MLRNITQVKFKPFLAMQHTVPMFRRHAIKFKSTNKFLSFTTVLQIVLDIEFFYDEDHFFKCTSLPTNQNIEFHQTEF